KDVVASLDKRVAGVETSMAELKNQVESLEGLGSDFESMREDFQVAFNTLSGDLKSEIHNLRDSFMGEIAKIREELGEEVSTLHQTIEDLQANVGIYALLCKKLIFPNTRRDSSKPKDRKVNHEKCGRDKNAQPKVDHARKPPIGKDKSVKTNYKSGGCFICDGPHRARDCPKKASLNGMSEDGGAEAVDEAERLGINATKGSGTIKAVNSSAKPIHGAIQFKKGFNKSEPCYLAVTRLETDEGSSKVEVPKVIERVLDEFEDVMPKEFPKKLPPRRKVDHTIELESGSKPPAKAPYRMSPPELV
nr:reverse transcriptase [Tanacetum cinerariifolium]